MSAPQHDPLASLLSRVLHYGGLASAVVLVAGLVLLIPARGTDRALVEQLRLPTAVGNVPPGLGVLIADAARGEAAAVILLGILLLIATPVIRVAAAVIHFVRRRDRAFATIGAIVLALLIVAFLMGRLGTPPAPSSRSEAPSSFLDTQKSTMLP